MRRVSAVCFALAASVTLSADSCDREDNGAIISPTQTSAAGTYRLDAVIRTGTDSVNVPFTFTTGTSNFALNSATLTLTANSGVTNAGSFNMSVGGTQNGIATNLGMPTAGTWSQNGTTVTFNGADFSTFTGTRSSNILRVTPVTIDGRGASTLRFTRL
ncbi:MAG TPA: hypothetical protein VKA84_17205 [Gemmatimonadaceae bacterium]|nr:hypothetical protein [Gemmatimonadaceae bacterium]